MWEFGILLLDRCGALRAATLAGALASPALAGDPTGLWQTPTNGGQVRIARCGQGLCGAEICAELARGQKLYATTAANTDGWKR